MPRRALSATGRRRLRARWETLRLDARPPRPVRATLHTHPLADYLFYGLYRTDRFDLDIPVDLSDVPPAACLGHFPQYVAFRDVASAADLPALVEDYYGEELARYDMPLDELRPLVGALAARYDAYLPFWNEQIFPLESQLLDAWREQLQGGEVMELLQRVTRLRWPFPEVHLYACYHHPTGSALTPHPHLFSTLFDRYAVEPSVAWFVGHEAVHLLLDAVAWWEHPEAAAGIRWLGSRHMAEEALCLALQNRLATICGLLPEAEMQVLRGSMKYLRVYRWLQEHWDDYQLDPARYPTVVEFFVTALREARAMKRTRDNYHTFYTAAAWAA